MATCLVSRRDRAGQRHKATIQAKHIDARDCKHPQLNPQVNGIIQLMDSPNTILKRAPSYSSPGHTFTISNLSLSYFTAHSTNV